MTDAIRRLWGAMPWFDGAGRFSLLRLVTLVLIALPAGWLALEFTSGNWDFPSPYVPLIYHSGLWATYLLLLSLLVTPLRRMTGLGRLAQLRRMLGVACFLYGVLHLLAWFGLRVWDWASLGNEALARPSLWAALVSLLILVALAATSFDSAIRALGAGRWKQLHRLVYFAALLAVLHFLLSPGSLQGAPFLMAGGYVWLMGWRWLENRRLGTSGAALAFLGLAASAFTLLLQPVWLVTFQAERMSATPWSAIADNFSPDIWRYLGIPPVWLMLAWTAASVAITALRRLVTFQKTISHS